ncbi:13269_t:CDS:1 [Cetraspora pellucida]|uniref:13269_t:CDS:1 n=1 Tax=Cetraspora pellucida TaxID=1433469 RepID=A0A9N9J3E7_9GLOM|nr:13269_t:CDS:1 [Cetraspora pellucida]
MNKAINNTNIDLDSEELDHINIGTINKVSRSEFIGGQRDFKELLQYIIPHLVQENVLSVDDPTLHIRISGDGRNVGRKVKHVMITFMILNDIKNHHIPNYHHTVILYPRVEKYEPLEFILNLLINDLRDLKNNGLNIANTLWHFGLYFSSNWKFLAICLGLNSANSNHFCAWCLCSKCEIGNIKQDW